jgi:hypothetical protein
MLFWHICVVLLPDALPEQERGAALTALVDAAWEAGEPLLALDLIKRGGTWIPFRQRTKWRSTPLWGEYWSGAGVSHHSCMHPSYNAIEFVMSAVHPRGAAFSHPCVLGSVIRHVHA